MNHFKDYIIIFGLIIIVAFGTFFIFFRDETIVLPPELEPVAEAVEPENNVEAQEIPSPEEIKGIYVTSWSASKKNYVDYVIDIAKNTEINGVVVDIKDWSGYVAYDTEVLEVEEYNAESIRIKDIGSLIQRFHDEGIYVIARITVFQDPILAAARSDLAVHSKSESLWLDNLGLAWIDPAATGSWGYNVSIAKEALKLGFDEVNFDYVRFPSDGNLRDMVFPFWDGITKRHLVIREFFKYLRQEIPYGTLSVDLFGLSASASNDLGVGQMLADAFEYFDYVCPMIYPSHYATGFLGYLNPAEYPYEVVKYSMENALRRLSAYDKLLVRDVKLRPWLQDFNLGAVYDSEMVKSEMRAVYGANQNDFAGFMLWNSLNIYTKEALQPAISEQDNSVNIK
ncbi:MAG: putative glycoside hydrolase [Candidatus Paceibacterota bacterium]|jgi:hypothetical protein